MVSVREKSSLKVVPESVSSAAISVAYVCHGASAHAESGLSESSKISDAEGLGGLLSNSDSLR